MNKENKSSSELQNVKETKTVDNSMDKRIYGIIGISSIMSNWNADFSGYPRTTSNGKIFATDKSLKYQFKNVWDKEGKKVIYIKSLTEGKQDELIPRTLEERYNILFNKEVLQENDKKNIFRNLFNAIDIKNFGATFAVSKGKNSDKGVNISITGAVQIGQGLNLYKDTTAEAHQILSPFRNPNEKKSSNTKTEENELDENNTENRTATSIGTKIIADEAHYFYPFVINPLAYREFVEMGVTEGYTEEDYQLFKKAACCSATSFATNAKIGCDNEFSMFVETNIDTYLPLLTQFVKFEKGQEKNIITINCGDLLNTLKDSIKSIEIYYNPYKIKLVTDIEGVKTYNIFTNKEVE